MSDESPVDLSTDLFAGLPDALRDELVDCYRKITSYYREHRWEPSELNAGKFCEIVYSIISGYLSGNFPKNASKPKNFKDACLQLEKIQSTGRAGDRSARILIPRCLIYLYEIRNNRGVGHVGGDVDSNEMDATTAVASCSWVMAELVRVFHNVSISEAQDAADSLIEKKVPLVWEHGDVRRVLDPKMSTSDQALALLYSTSGWCKLETLRSWCEYKNKTRFRSSVIGDMHTSRLVEFDPANSKVCLTPLGIAYVENELLV